MNEPASSHTTTRTDLGHIDLRRLRDLPGPRGRPLLGNLGDIEPSQFHRQLASWADEFGSLYVFRLATQYVLVVADTDLIQQILRDRPARFRRWRKLEQLAADINADGVFTAEGVQWRRQRKFVMHALNAGHVREFVPRLEVVVGRLRRRWWRAAITRRAVNVLEDLMRLTVDVTSGLAFGKDINTLEEKIEPIQKHLDRVFPAIARRQTALFPYWRYVQLPHDRKVAAAVSAIGEFIEGLISETRARLADAPPGTKPGNLLEALILAQEKDGGLSNEEISANVMTLLLAGEDTTANTLSYMIHFMMEHPEMQRALQREVDKVFNESEQPWQDPATPERLHYLEAFAKETMRCKPVGGQVFLEANEDSQVGDVRVPAGTPVMCLSGYVGQQDGNFADADVFRPERWLQSDEDGSAAHRQKAFMPFGAGPRFCPGRELAMLQIKMVISMLCREFEVTRPSRAAPLQDVYHFTVGPSSVLADLHPRGPVRAERGSAPSRVNRRHAVEQIGFPDRRVSDRRKLSTSGE